MVNGATFSRNPVIPFTNELNEAVVICCGWVSGWEILVGSAALRHPASAAKKKKLDPAISPTVDYGYGIVRFAFVFVLRRSFVLYVHTHILTYTHTWTNPRGVCVLECGWLALATYHLSSSSESSHNSACQQLS